MINHIHIPTGKQSLSNTSENKTRFGGYGGCVGVGTPSLTLPQIFMKTIFPTMTTIRNGLDRFFQAATQKIMKTVFPSAKD